MATFLDIGLLQKFDFIFPFLLVMVVVWGTLSYSKFMGDNKFAHSLIALLLGLLVLMSGTIREIINKMAPWFILLFIFIFFLLVLSKFGGDDGSPIGESYGWLKNMFLILAFIIAVVSVIDVTVWESEDGGSDSVVSGGDVGGSGKSAFFATLRHPSVLGLVLIFFIATFTILRLSSEA